MPISPQRIIDVGVDEHESMEGEYGMADNEDIAGAKDHDMTEFEPVERESAHAADVRRGHAVWRSGTEAESAVSVRLAADE